MISGIQIHSGKHRSVQAPMADSLLFFKFTCDFRPLTVISDNLGVISEACKAITERNIVDEIESLMSARNSTKGLCY